MIRIYSGTICAFLLFVVASAMERMPDFPGPYCATRPGGCCRDRIDGCSVPISSMFLLQLI